MVLATVITVVNYNRKTFIAQAIAPEKFAVRVNKNNSLLVYQNVFWELGHVSLRCK